MPELPEVETVKESLKLRLNNKKIPSVYEKSKQTVFFMLNFTVSYMFSAYLSPNTQRLWRKALHRLSCRGA